MKVKFEGARGRDYQGDIAIDAISFTPGSCSFQTPKPPTPRPTNPPTRPTNPPTRPTNPPTQAGTIVVYHLLPLVNNQVIIYQWWSHACMGCVPLSFYLPRSVYQLTATSSSFWEEFASLPFYPFKVDIQIYYNISYVLTWTCFTFPFSFQGLYTNLSKYVYAPRCSFISPIFSYNIH